VGEPLKRSALTIFMLKYLRNVFLIALILLGSERIFAKEWRGIIPLRSTRADVVRLLGQCAEQREACVFSLAEEKVYILFSGGLQDAYQDCAKRLAAETVVFIHVQPKSKLRLEDLHLNRRQLTVFDSTAPLDRGSKGYRTMDGLVVDVFKGRVVQLEYIADPSDQYVCQSYYEQPELFIQTLMVHPPLTLAIDCPSYVVTSGTKLTLRAFAGVDSKRGPDWAVNAGKIISGQHT
jgi:hypothetical protein